MSFGIELDITCPHCGHIEYVKLNMDNNIPGKCYMCKNCSNVVTQNQVKDQVRDALEEFETEIDRLTEARLEDMLMEEPHNQETE